MGPGGIFLRLHGRARQSLRLPRNRQTDDQLDFAQSYGFHIPARKSLVEKAGKLKSGPAADAAKLATENGHAQTPILWSPKAGSAYSDALNKIIRSGADPAVEIKTVKSVTEAELKRITG